MLLEFGAQEREAQCCRCHRRSPVLFGDQAPALDRLIELGWLNEREHGWCCPVCANRLSGEYRVTSR